MNLLAIDTSCDICSVTISINGNIDSKEVIINKGHSRYLAPLVDDIIHENDIKVNNINAILLSLVLVRLKN